MLSEAEQLEAALAASVAPADVPQDEEDEQRQIEEAIRLSAMEASSSIKANPETRAKPARLSSSPSVSMSSAGPLSVQEQLRERAERMKRRADSEATTSDNHVRPPPAKRQATVASPVPGPSNIHGFSNIKQENASSSGCPMSLRGGALRITRTPGRTNDKNVVSLPDIIKKQHLVSACIFSFFIAQDELFQHLPLSKSTSSSDVPIYIGRDPSFDPYVRIAAQEAEINIKGKVTNKQLEQIKPELRRLYKKDYGANFNAFYAWCSGSSHTKILVLVYPTFLRLAITSCNMMNIDTVLGDNHYYLHDFPKLAHIRKTQPQGFEADLLSHLQSLNTPDAFLDTIRGQYDYSSVKVHLITSIPGTFSGAKANKHGLLRLRSVIKDLGLKLPKMEDEGKLELEVCAASIGNLNKKWIDQFYDCALGRKTLEVQENEDDIVVPKMKIVYPTVQDVKRCYAESQQAASNIGCHTRPWDKAPRAIQELFHHYKSTDDRRLHHQKFICAFNTSSSSSLPYYIYIGSANLSQSAWGALEVDKKGNKETSDMKLVKMSNYECGVLVPGDIIMELLEPETKDWKKAVIPYERPLQPYNLATEKPWNDPRWAKGYDPSQAPEYSGDDYGLNMDTMQRLSVPGY